MSNDIFPTIKRNLSNLIEDQEGNIPASKLLMLGAMVLILGNLLSLDALASHSSHSSHKSHSSHSSGSHGNHGNHGSHESHISHQSHTSHSNTASHSNSLYSNEGDVQYSAPSVNSVPKVKASVNTNQTVLTPPIVNGTIETPEGTPAIGEMPDFAVPLASVDVSDLATEIHTPKDTPLVR